MINMTRQQKYILSVLDENYESFISVYNDGDFWSWNARMWLSDDDIWKKVYKKTFQFLSWNDYLEIIPKSVPSFFSEHRISEKGKELFKNDSSRSK